MSDIQTIKYRLVGAVVIVIGFALLWSVLLDHEAKRKVNASQLDMPPQTFNVERFDIKDPQNIPSSTPAIDELPVTVDESEAAMVESAAVTKAEPQKVEASDLKKIDAPEVKKAEPVVSVVPEVKKAPLTSVVSTPAKSAVLEKATTTTNYSKLDEKGLPEAWVLQLASVKNKQNALDLQKKLVDAHFPAYVKSTTTGDGLSYRVLVGPKVSREQMEIMARDIEKQKGIKGIIVRFQVGYER